MLLNTEIFCEYLKPFLLRIRVIFYENTTRNKKSSHFDLKIAFLSKCFIKKTVINAK